ncbi:class I SAM-dependent methyltransferase [Brachyspira pilosicoli]|uniref:class I SAM-dependent methyltransferase n=1 Tax=Brachyspira pilosicoli TaxID=52584 RepID=UPI002543F203|nr:class I SAM-dependent methyltransferase [Brachyspira pilosicoli]WIH82534.1 class I SAM-dependent methyltransferase [Brachyspira pilosicoli]
MYNHNLFYNEQYEIKGQKYDEQINEWSQKYESLMLIEQKRFLMSIISENKMKNVLEIGVWNGVSSLCILKSGIENNNNFQLYSIDFENNDFIAAAVNHYCSKEEKEHYHINKGKTVFDIENIVPKDIKFDLVFIDAGHSHPFPLFDLIFSIPYMHENTIIILHDIIDYMVPNAWGESFIFESWTGDKYRLYTNFEKNIYSTMGCIKLHKTKEELYNNIKIISDISLRANPWAINYYQNNKNINDIDNKNKNLGLGFNLKDIEKIKNYMEKYYTDEFSEQINTILINNYNNYMKNCYLYMHETRLLYYLYKNIDRIHSIDNNINYIAYDNDIKYNSLNRKLDKLINMIVWWIPIKKIRDNIRKKLNE